MIDDKKHSRVLLRASRLRIYSYHCTETTKKKKDIYARFRNYAYQDVLARLYCAQVIKWNKRDDNTASSWDRKEA